MPATAGDLLHGRSSRRTETPVFLFGIQNNEQADHPLRQDLGRPRRRRRRRRHQPHLHRSPPRPRGDQPAGVRGPPHGRAQGPRPEQTLAVVDHNVPTTDRSKGIANPEVGDPGQCAREERRGVRHRVLRRARPPAGHRPRHRPGAGLHAARHDHRLRRQPHLDPWRLRRARPRHRHLGGRARARHPDADPEEGEEHAGHRRRRAAAGRDRQGHHPRHHRRDRHRRRHRPRHRVSPARRSGRCRWKAG